MGLRGPTYLLINPFKIEFPDRSVDLNGHLPFAIYHIRFREGLAAFVGGQAYDNPYVGIGQGKEQRAWQHGWQLGFRKFGEH